MTSPSGELTLEITRVLPADPSVVFGAFSAPDELAKSWGPEGFTIPSLNFRAPERVTGSRCNRRKTIPFI